MSQVSIPFHDEPIQDWHTGWCDWDGTVAPGDTTLWDLLPPQYKPEHPSPLPDPWTGCHRVCKNLWDSPTVGSQLHFRYWFILYPLDNFNHNANRGKHHHLPCHLDFKLRKNNHSKPSPGTVAGSNCFVTAALDSTPSSTSLQPPEWQVVPRTTDHHWTRSSLLALSISPLSVLILSSALLLLKLP